jgi:hypothetical protein
MTSDTVQIDILAHVENAVSGLTDFVKSIGLAYISYEGLKRLIVDSVKEFMEAEQADARLGAALKITGQYSKESMESLKRMSETLQMTSIYTHDETESAAGLLMQLGNLSVQGVQKIMPHLQDFASSMGIDLVQAATLVGKTLGGTTNMLGRYGVVIKETHDKGVEFNEIMGQLNDKFGGMSQAIGDTLQGKLTQLKNNWKDLKEEIGGVIAAMMNPALNSVLAQINYQKLKGIDVRNVDLDTLKQYEEIVRKAVENFSQAILTPGNATQMAVARDELTKAGQLLQRIQAQIQELQKIAPKGIPNVLVPKQDAFESVIDGFGYLANNIGQIPLSKLDKIVDDINSLNAAQKYNPISLSSLDKIAGVMDKTQTIPYKPISLSSLDQIATTSTMTEYLAKQAIELQKVRDLWTSIGNEIVKIGNEIGKAIATGDWQSMFKDITVQLLDLLSTYAITAAAAAAVAQNWGMAAFWLGVAGVSAITGGIIGSLGSGTPSTGGLPSYASGTNYVPRTGLALLHKGEQVVPAGQSNGGNTVINVYGGMWQEDDLARSVMRAAGRM